jgi:hypothetical protein
MIKMEELGKREWEKQRIKGLLARASFKMEYLAGYLDNAKRVIRELEAIEIALGEEGSEINIHTSELNQLVHKALKLAEETEEYLEYLFRKS